LLFGFRSSSSARLATTHIPSDQEETRLADQEETRLADQEETRLADQEETRLADQEETRLADQEERRLAITCIPSDIHSPAHGNRDGVRRAPADGHGRRSALLAVDARCSDSDMGRARTESITRIETLTNSLTSTD
jgi:hypothetical protein